MTANHTPRDGFLEIPSSQKVHKESRIVEGELGQLNSKIILERKGERGFKTIDDLKDKKTRAGSWIQHVDVPEIDLYTLRAVKLVRGYAHPVRKESAS